MPIFRRPNLGEPIVSEPRRPHEIDGDIYPIEEGEEFEGPQSEPRTNPLDDLQEENPKPPDKTGGLLTSEQALLGRTVSVPPHGRAEILRLQAPIEEFASEFALTVGQVGLPFSTVLTVTDERRDYAFFQPGFFTAFQSIYALIEWGVGGVQKFAIVDVVPEQVIALQGTFLRVTGVNLADWGGGPDRALDMSAHISLLPPTRSKPVQKTTPVGLILAGATTGGQFWPPFARSLRFYRTPFSTTSFRVRFTDPAANILGEVDVPVNTDCPEIPIPGHATFWEILNTTGAVNITRGYVIFGLEL